MFNRGIPSTLLCSLLHSYYTRAGYASFAHSAENKVLMEMGVWFLSQEQKVSGTVCRLLMVADGRLWVVWQPRPWSKKL